MSRLPIVSRVRPPQFLSKTALLLSAALLLCSVGSVCLAQEKNLLATPATLKAGQLQNMQISQATQAKATAGAIVGTWGNSRSDKETGEEETSIIEFSRDGSYSTRLRNNKFPDQEKMPLAGGRYTVTDADKAGFTLVLDRTSGDPEEDKATAKTTMAVVMVDEKTLRAPDGSLLARIK